MQKKLTITDDEHINGGLRAVVGKDWEIAYEEMSRDEVRESEALEWAEAALGDVADETR